MTWEKRRVYARKMLKRNKFNGRIKIRGKDMILKDCYNIQTHFFGCPNFSTILTHSKLQKTFAIRLLHVLQLHYFLWWFSCSGWQEAAFKARFSKLLVSVAVPLIGFWFQQFWQFPKCDFEFLSFGQKKEKTLKEIK